MIYARVAQLITLSYTPFIIDSINNIEVIVHLISHSLSLSLLSDPVPFREGYFGLTNIPILLSDMLCDGSEANISLCSSSRPFFCTHSHDVGVACLNSSTYT